MSQVLNVLGPLCLWQCFTFVVSQHSICLCLLEDVQALIPTKCCPSCLSFKGWSLHREATQSKRHPPISEILCVRLFLNISILIYIPFVISMYGFNITGWGVGGGGVCEGVCGH